MAHAFQADSGFEDRGLDPAQLRPRLTVDAGADHVEKRFVGSLVRTQSHVFRAHQRRALQLEIVGPGGAAAGIVQPDSGEEHIVMHMRAFVAQDVRHDVGKDHAAGDMHPAIGRAGIEALLCCDIAVEHS